MIINFKVLIVLGCILLLSVTSAKPSNSTQSAPRDHLTKEDIKLEDQFAEEDSDMLMEPSDRTDVTVVRSQELPSPRLRTIHNSHLTPRGPVDAQRAKGDDPHIPAAQNFYPHFLRDIQPLGHSRPYFGFPEGPVPRYVDPRANIHPALGLFGIPVPRTAGFDPGLLGSGDFGVIRGGTFYPPEEIPYHPVDSIDFVQKYTYPEEQFAHFRDFADIHSPVDTDFSRLVVVYAPKNTTRPSKHPHPKNIFEQLQLLDREEELKEKKSKQTSKSKTKLANTKLQKKYKKKLTPKNLEEEPLLAVS